MNQKINVAGSRSNTGCVREHNEDSVVVQAPLYAVADGMGGHAAGEVASEIAVDILAENASLIRDANALIETVRTINRSIIDAASNGLGRPGMGTTLTAAILDGSRLLIAQVGDSRAYLLHDQQLQQLTRDHSYVGELLAGGHISPSEAASHPKRSVITRALGSDIKTEADIYELEAAAGDRLLICTDGLYGMVSDNDISAVLESEDDPQTACDALIQAAREGGGLDNISAIVVDINAEESEFLSFGENDDDSSMRDSLTKRRSATKARGRSRRIHLGVITFVILLVLLIGGAVGGVYWYAYNSFFIRADEGAVAIFRGHPSEVLPGLHLEWLEESTDVRVADLPTYIARNLEEGVEEESLEKAQTVISGYREQIAEQQNPQSGSSAQGSSSTQGSSSAQNSASTQSSSSTQNSTSTLGGSLSNNSANLSEGGLSS